jgi:hypothetical protein
MGRKRARMKLALVTIVTANLEERCVFYQEGLPIEPQVSRGNCVELPLEARILALWRPSECAAFGDHIDARHDQSQCPDEVCRRG